MILLLLSCHATCDDGYAAGKDGYCYPIDWSNAADLPAAHTEEEEIRQNLDKNDPIFHQVDSGNILINEIYPKAQDGETDFIELYNAGEETVDLGSYLISNTWLLDGQSLSFTTMMGEDNGSYFLAPSEYLVLWCKNGEVGFSGSDFTTDFSLQNRAATITLLDAKGTVIQQIAYLEVKRGFSYGRGLSNHWGEMNPTPGGNNVGE